MCWGASLLLIAIIRYVDAQIICIPEQSYCYQGGMMWLWWSYPHCLGQDAVWLPVRVCVSVCVCVQGGERVREKGWAAQTESVRLCAPCHLHSMSMSNWLGLIPLLESILHGYQGDSIRCLHCRVDRNMSARTRVSARTHTHADTHTHSLQIGTVANVQEPKSLLISSIY